MITGLYAGIFALLFVVLTILTIRQRIRHDQRIGDDGRHELRQHIRAHGNFSEYVPFGLLMMLLLEMQNTSSYWLHGIGMVFLIGRAAHAYGLIAQEIYRDNIFVGSIRLRQIGMVVTLSVLTIEAILLLMEFFN